MKAYHNEAPFQPTEQEVLLTSIGTLAQELYNETIYGSDDVEGIYAIAVKIKALADKARSAPAELAA